MDNRLDRRTILATAVATGAAVAGCFSFFRSSSEDVAKGLEALQRARRAVEELFYKNLGKSIKDAESITNHLLDMKQLPYRADFNISRGALQAANTDSYDAVFNLRPLSSKLFFDTGAYRAERTPHFLAFCVGIAGFLRDAQAAKEAAAQSPDLKGIDVKLLAEITGSADGDGFDSVLSIKYGGEYGSVIDQGGVIVNKVTKDIHISAGKRIRNYELAFLRAYGIGQALYNTMIEMKVSQSMLRDVQFFADEYKSVGQEYRFGIIKLLITNPEQKLV